jgi:murein tripeptide amidase MpaA
MANRAHDRGAGSFRYSKPIGIGRNNANNIPYLGAQLRGLWFCIRQTAVRSIVELRNAKTEPNDSAIHTLPERLLPMTPLNFDRYYDYERLTVQLQEYVGAYPGLLQLQSIGASYEGRTIWLVTATNFATGPAEEKPAFWVDGNIHAIELAGSAAALYLIDRLVHAYGNDPDVTRCLDSRAFYICPRANPDGAECALAEQPRLIRSSVRPYPYDEEALEGLSIEDVDGDGRLLSMRIADPNGHWKVCPEEPRLLVPREPAEFGGRYYRLLPEGRIRNYDGISIDVPPAKEGLDLNRNFPVGWQGEYRQKGAGPYPTSEPEVRALVDFIARHPNICSGVSFHTYSGVLLRPYSYQADANLPAEDLWTYQTIGAKGTQLTGYPAVSSFHDFKYHPNQITTGVFDDWLYEEQGAFGWTVELWSPHRQAGIEGHKFIEWYRTHPQEDDLKLLRWSDEALGGQGYIDWYPFEHPELGSIELGGWNPLYNLWNPPPDKLEEELSPFPRWLVWHNLISPRLELVKAEAIALGDGNYRVRLAVENTGWLPTYVTKKAQDKKKTRGVLGEIELPATAELISGKRRQELGQLEGRAYKPCSTFLWLGQSGDSTNNRASFEWIVQADEPSRINLTASHDRAGVVRAELTVRPA